MKYFKFFSISLLIFTTSCKSDKIENTTSPEGSWEGLGYGRAINIEANGDFQSYDITLLSCLPYIEGNLEMLGDKFKLVNDTLSYSDGINTYFFIRTEELPITCTDNHYEDNLNNPEHNFEVLAETFKEHYAYFDLRKVDWDEMYKRYRLKVTPQTSEAELYIIMEDMLDEFNDGHIGLDAPDEVIQKADSIRSLKNVDEVETNQTSQKKYNTHLVANIIADEYLDEQKSRAYRLIQWGILDGNIGYLQVNQMAGLANYGIPDSLSRRDYWMTYFEKSEHDSENSRHELESIISIMDEAMTDLKDTDAIILDARFNGGGQDEVGLEIMSRFNNRERLVFTKKARLKDSYTKPIEVILKSHKDYYNKPVYLLTSYESASATEIMILSSILLDNVIRIGSATEGVFSDVLDKELPNGWEFGLSNEVYLDTKNKNYEGVGIPPHHDLGYTRETQVFFNNIVNGLPEDKAISKALALIKQSSTN